MNKCVLKIAVLTLLFVLISCNGKQNKELNPVNSEAFQEEETVEEKVAEQEPVVQEVEQETKKEDEIIIERPATYTFSFEGKYYTPFRSDRLYGCIDDELNVKLKPAYKFISMMKDGFYCSLNLSSGEFYNQNMKLLYSSDSMKFQGTFFYDERNNFPIKYSLNLNDGSITKVNDSDNYSHVYFSGEDFGLVIEKDSSDNKTGLSVGDLNGNVIARNIEHGYIRMTEGLMAIVFKDGKSGFIDKNGNLALEMPLYVDPDWIGPKSEPSLPYFFKDGMAIVRSDGKAWIILDKNGNTTAIPEMIRPTDYSFSEGLLSVRNTSEGNKAGFMNKEMEFKIPCVFDSVEYFRNGYAVVVYNGEDAVLDKQGNVYLSKDLLEGNKEPFVNVLNDVQFSANNEKKSQ